MECKNKNIPLAALFSVVKQQHITFLNKILEDEDINAGQAAFLIYLTYNEKVCQEDIANHYKLDKGTVARGIKKLDEANLISREIDEKNRRRYNISLNEKGKKLGEKIIEADAKWDEMIYSEINIPNELLYETLRRIATKTLEINEMEDLNGNIERI